MGSAAQYKKLNAKQKSIRQIELLDHEVEIVKLSYPDYNIVEVRPKFNKETGQITYPTYVDYIEAIRGILPSA